MYKNSADGQFDRCGCEGVKNVVFELNSFISQNFRSFTESGVKGTDNIIWQIVLDQIIFLNLKLLPSEIRLSGVKRFGEHTMYQILVSIDYKIML